MGVGRLHEEDALAKVKHDGVVYDGKYSAIDRLDPRLRIV